MKNVREDATEAGFTMLEMLVVLALLSLLMVVLTGTIYLGINARARVTAVAMDVQDFSSFRRILTEKLVDAYPQWISNSQASFVDFNGDATHINFLGPALETQGAGFSRYDVSLATEDGKPAIFLQAAYDEGGSQTALTTYFAPGLARLKLAYFGPPPGGGAAAWQNAWVTRPMLPTLIAIEVTFPSGDRRAWPEIVIKPEIDGDITCEIDANTHGCAGR